MGLSEVPEGSVIREFTGKDGESRESLCPCDAAKGMGLGSNTLPVSFTKCLPSRVCATRDSC